jgi:hypothetical protein
LDVNTHRNLIQSFFNKVLSEVCSGYQSMEHQNALVVIGTVIEYKPKGQKYSSMSASRILFKKGINFYLPG